MAEIAKKKTVKAAPEKKAEAVKEVATKDEKKAVKVSAKEAKKAEKEAKKAEAAKTVEKPQVTEARAFARDVRVTPRKVRLVADYIRGKSVSDALGILSRVNKVGCLPIEKIIKSASANAVNNFGMNKDTLFIAEIQVSDGVRIKRFTPRAKGSASPLIRRNANILCVVKERK
jgi:large subunit ribosomal protein L22